MLYIPGAQLRLLNRQITSEALMMLHNRPPVVDTPVENQLLEEGDVENGQVPEGMRLITYSTLQNVCHLVLTIREREYIHGLEHFLRVFAGTAASSPAVTEKTNGVQSPPTSRSIVGSTSTQPTSSFPHLKTLHTDFRDSGKSDILAYPGSPLSYPDPMLHEALRPLSKIRGLEHVVFEGDLPPSYPEPLKAIMMAPVGATKGLLKPMAVTANGQEVHARNEGLGNSHVHSATRL
ncbi:hypothetical protein KC361_g8701 [Hortaea werneckii]|nr:hypothetical protein KC361_g8701 [Hortaea werneckii]